MADFALGNKLGIYTTVAPTLDASTEQFALRFTAQQNKTVEKIRIYVQTLTGTSPTFRIGLQALDGSDEPDGTWLGATNSGYGDAQLAAGWNIITLGETVSLTASTGYAVRIEYQSGTIDASNKITVRCSYVVHSDYRVYQPFNASDNDSSYDDALMAFLSSTNSGSSWSNLVTYCPIFLLENDDASYSGMPYLGSGTAFEIYGANRWASQKITVTTNVTVQRLWAIFREDTTAAGDFLYEIWGPDSDDVLRSGIMYAAAGPAIGYTWQYADLSSDLDLVSGSEYRIVFKSPDSVDGANCWEIAGMGCTDSAEYKGITYGGTTCLFSTTINGGAGWTDVDETDMAIYFENGLSVNVTVEPSAQALTLAQQTPAENFDFNFDVNAQVLALTLTAPDVSGDANVSPSALALALTSPAPTPVWSSSVSPSTITLALTQQTPTVSGTANVTPNALALTLTQQTPTFAYDFALDVSALELIASLKDPTISTETPYVSGYVPLNLGFGFHDGTASGKPDGISLFWKGRIVDEKHYEPHLTDGKDFSYLKEIPERVKRMHGAVGEVTDYLTVPLMPSLKRRRDNQLAMFLENNTLHNKTLFVRDGVKGAKYGEGVDSGERLLSKWKENNKTKA